MHSHLIIAIVIVVVELNTEKKVLNQIHEWSELRSITCSSTDKIPVQHIYSNLHMPKTLIV